MAQGETQCRAGRRPASAKSANASFAAAAAAVAHLPPQIEVCDIWTHYTPWPCNQPPKSYSFMVKYSVLWRLK